MEKIKLSAIRQQFPMYGDMSDDQLLIALRKKFYSDIPPGQFYSRIDYDTQRIDPTEGMSGLDKFRAGMGKSFADLGRTAMRLGNMVGIGNYDQAAAKADAELDKPLMDTGAGQAGKVVGDLALTAVPGYRAQQSLTRGVTAGATMLPRAAAAATRGAAPYIGAAGAGAVAGAALSPEDMSGGAGMGALAGVGGEVGGRVLSAGYGGAKAILEPLYEGGRERILKRTLERFATDPAAVRRTVEAASDVTVPGRFPTLRPQTLAEATMDPGIAQLQRGAAAASSDVASALAEARGRQVAGYRSVLDELAGDEGKRAFFTEMRDSTADSLYTQARAGGLNMTPELQSTVTQLMQRPSIQSAIAQAKVLAKEKGQDIADPAGSAAGLMYVDRALGDQIGDAVRAGRGELADALKETQNELRAFLDVASPAYGEARRQFQAMSRPVNQMAIGQELAEKALPPLDALSNGALARVNANSYANALRNADATAARATGLRSAKMANVLDPDQLRAVQNVGEDMARYAAAQELAKVPGSPTAQYLGAQNVLRQFMGPLGLPETAADSMAGRVAAGLMGTPFRWTQSKTEQLLAQALTDPAVAAKIMAAKDPKTIAQILQPYMAQVAIQADTE
jgi:hypothetical protein